MSSRVALASQLRKWAFALENGALASIEVHAALKKCGITLVLSSETGSQQLDAIFSKLDEILSRQGGCQFREDNPVMRHMLAPGEQRQAVKHINQWVGDATELIICDPYLFQFHPTPAHRTEAQYSDALCGVIPRHLERLEVFHFVNPNRRILKRISKFCQSRGIKFHPRTTNEIHDRIWIKNSSAAISVGTSFGGYGNRYFFIVPLPEKDVRMLCQQLARIRGS